MSHKQSIQLLLDKAQIKIDGTQPGDIQVHNDKLYARVLASKQAPINRVYGDWLLYLNQVNKQQQAEIASLRAELSALRAEQRANGPGR